MDMQNNDFSPLIIVNKNSELVKHEVFIIFRKVSNILNEEV